MSRILTADRVFSGLCIVAALAILVGKANAGSYSVLYAFQGGSTGGAPAASVIVDKGGNLYGTTEVGGLYVRRKCENGCGTLFKLTPGGTESILYAFAGRPDDGNNPFGALTTDKAGNIYGITTYGGRSRGCGVGCGVLYEVAGNDSEQVLYRFGSGSGGWQPDAGLTRDTAGNFYGTAAYGGSRSCDLGCGTVYELSPNGAETVLHAFAGGTDGEVPSGGVISDASGNLFGTTELGGSGGRGTVYELMPDGTKTNIYAFAGASDGDGPTGGLVEDTKGNLYGTTVGGGSGSNCLGGPGCGTVFEIAPDGTETILHAFLGGSDGAFPEFGRLLRDKAGNLYGTTSEGGDGTGCAYGCGVVFKIRSDGEETILHVFSGGSDGAYPLAGLVRDGKGNLIGTASSGGARAGCCGTVYSLKP